MDAERPVPARAGGVASRIPASRSAWRRSDRPRRIAVGAILGLDVATLVCVLAHVGGPARELLGLLAVGLVPGAALVSLLRLKEPVLELALTLALGPAALVLVAQLVSTLGVWHLFGVEVAVLIASAVPLSWQLARLATLRVPRR